jgi:hypothetical protein
MDERERACLITGIQLSINSVVVYFKIRQTWVNICMQLAFQLWLELFDAKVPSRLDFSYNRDDNSYGGEVYGRFTVGNVRYNVQFSGVSVLRTGSTGGRPRLWTIAFGVYDDYDGKLSGNRTNQWQSTMVLAGILGIVRRFIQREKPEAIVYQPADDKLAQVYRRLEMRFATDFPNYQQVRPGFFVRKDMTQHVNQFDRYIDN